MASKLLFLYQGISRVYADSAKCGENQQRRMRMDEAVAFRYFKIKHFAYEIVRQMRNEAMKLGFDSEEVRIKQPVEAKYRLEKESSNCEYSLIGNWFDETGAQLGFLRFHPDGSFYVEQGIVKPHPNDKRWFVEAINAWGKGTQITSEAKLQLLSD